MAIGAMEALEEANINIPEQVKMLGFNNQPIATFAHIHLLSGCAKHNPPRPKGVKMEGRACRVRSFANQLFICCFKEILFYKIIQDKIFSENT